MRVKNFVAATNCLAQRSVFFLWRTACYCIYAITCCHSATRPERGALHLAILFFKTRSRPVIGDTKRNHSLLRLLQLAIISLRY